jgi:hypothetical protein
MVRKMLFATVPAAIAVLGSVTPHVMAGSSTDNGKRQVERSAAHSVVQHRRHLAHRDFVHGFGDGTPAYYAVPPKVSAHRWPGYVYVPGKGILDEACNLPTSACPNEMRDVR